MRVLRAVGWIAELFIEALAVALAEALVAALGWTFRKARKWWRKRRKRNPED